MLFDASSKKEREREKPLPLELEVWAPRLAPPTTEQFINGLRNEKKQP